jgi:hypothetical protein
MPIFHDVAQYSEGYKRLELGVATNSNFPQEHHTTRQAVEAVA